MLKEKLVIQLQRYCRDFLINLCWVEINTTRDDDANLKNAHEEGIKGVSFHAKNGFK